MFMTRNAEKISATPPTVAGMLEDILGCKWSMTVLDLVESGVQRPGAMERAVWGLSTKVLNERLRKLQRFGLLEKVQYAEVPPRVEYRLTAFGREFSRLIAEVRRLQQSLNDRGRS